MGIKFKNDAVSALAGALTTLSTDILIDAADDGKFPVIAAIGADYFYLTLEDSSHNIEIVKIVRHVAASNNLETDGTADSGVNRGLDGTTARAWAIGDVVEIRPNAKALEDAIAATDNHIANATAAHAASAISNAPSGNIAAINVQAAINELDTEKKNAGVEPISTGGTGATTAAAARDTLGAGASFSGNIAGAFINYTSTAPMPSLLSGALLILNPSVSPTPGGWSLNVNGLGGKTVLRINGTTVRDGDVVVGNLAFLMYDGTLDSYILLNPLTNYGPVLGQVISTTILNSTVTAGGVILASLASVGYLGGGSEYVIINAEALMTKGATAGVNGLSVSQTAGTGTMTFDVSRDDRYCVNGITMYSRITAIGKQTVTGTVTISLTGLSAGSDSTCTGVKLTATRIRTLI